LPVNERLSNMPKHDHTKHPVMTNPYFDKESAEKDPDTVDAKSEKWLPTPEVFKAFLVRDYELATHNINMLMRSKRGPMSAKELKEQTLHSSDVIERVLTSGVATSKMTEANGRYSLVGV